MKEVWKAFDPEGDNSLNKQEIADIFKFRFEEAEELKPRYVENIHDYAKSRGGDRESSARPVGSKQYGAVDGQKESK